jgi:peptide deformylase
VDTIVIAPQIAESSSCKILYLEGMICAVEMQTADNKVTRAKTIRGFGNKRENESRKLTQTDYPQGSL